MNVKNSRIPVLEVKKLTVTMGAAPHESTVLNDIHLSVNKGSILCIVGESGSGKTLTSLACLGLLPASANRRSGCIIFDGVDMAGKSEKEWQAIRGKRISMVLQNPMDGFNPVRTIGAHFTETLKAHAGLKGKEAKARSIQFLEEAGLPDAQQLLKKHPFQLSGGMLQRVMIAIAVASPPDVLIADEPTTALDTGSQKHILHQLDRIRRETGMGMIIITHDLGVVAEIADEVAVMYKGTIVEAGSVYQVFDAPVHEYTRTLLRSRV